MVVLDVYFVTKAPCLSPFFTFYNARVHQRRLTMLGVLAMIYTCFSVSAHAQTSFTDFASFKHICDQSPSKCIKQSDAFFNNIGSNHPDWIEAKVLVMRSHYRSVDIEPLLLEIPMLLQHKRLDPYQRLSLLSFYSKGLKISGNTNLFNYYSTQATELLALMNTSTDKALPFIEYANMLLDKGEHQRAERILLRAEQIVEVRGTAIEKRELYANLGHIAHKQKQYIKRLGLSEKSLEASIAVGEQQQVAVAQFNVASSYQSLKNWDKAVEFFELSHATAEAEKDTYLADSIQLRLIKIEFARGNTEAAKKRLAAVPDKINVDHVLTKRAYDALVNEFLDQH